jgi:hypothetical protein
MQRGFTLTSMIVASLLSFIVLAGAWTLYVDYRNEIKVEMANLSMNKYAESTIRELVNDLSTAWGAECLSQTQHNTRWRFYIDDVIQENGPIQLWDYRRAPDGSIELTYNQGSGILINGLPPKWADRQYVFHGRQPSLGEVMDIDSRDHIVFDNMMISFNDFSTDIGPIADPVQRRQLQSVIRISFTMTYTCTQLTHVGVLASNRVIRKTYDTQIFMRNWDVESNPYKTRLVAL